MDINALRDRLANLNRKSSKGNDVWKPKDEHQVRLLQYPHSDDPFLELSFHYEIGDAPPVLCPQQFGKDCPICTFADLLKAWKDPDGNDKPEKTRKQDFELFKKIQSKARVYVPMIERGKEEEGPKFWGMTPAQAQQALEVCLDGDRLEALGLEKDDAKNGLRVLFDPDKGYDLAVSFAKPGEKGNTKTFTAITIKGRIKNSALAKDKASVKKILEGVKKIGEVFPEVSTSEVDKIFKKFVGSGASEAVADGGTEKYAGPAKTEAAPKPSNTNENAKVSGTRSIDEAFGDMLADDAS